MKNILIIKNKKGLIFRNAFFALIAVSLIITAVGVIINSWNTTYDSGLLYDLDEYDKLDDLSAEAGQQQSDINVKSTNTGEDFEGTSIRGVFGILNNIYRPFRIVFGDQGMLDSITERFGIPNYIRIALVTFMVMGITFALVAVLFRLSRVAA